MKKTFRFYRFQKPARDFTFALIAFTCLFAIISPSNHDVTPIPIVSLFHASSASAATAQVPSHAKLPAGLAPKQYVKSFSAQPLPSMGMPLISTVLALVFSSIVAFNLALLRHLRRVNASSRRGAWREG
jgi:hypothetical protein